MTPQCSCVPRPPAPMNPVACESSTTTVAPCRSASSQMPGSGAIVPSIENTPSVTTRRDARARGLAQPGLELAEVAVVVAQALRLRQADAVDDARVVERVRDDRVLLAGQRLEQAAVGVEAGRIEDRVVGAEEGGEPALELAVHGLGAADEAYRGHAVAVAVERRVGGGDDRRVVGEPEVVVGAEVQHLAPVLEADHGILRRGDDALALEQPRAREFRRLGFEPIEQRLVHAFAHRGQRRIIPAARAAPRIIAAGRTHESKPSAPGLRARTLRIRRPRSLPRARRGCSSRSPGSSSPTP